MDLGDRDFHATRTDLLTLGIKNLPASEAATINYLQVIFGSIIGIVIF